MFYLAQLNSQLSDLPKSVFDLIRKHYKIKYGRYFPKLQSIINETKSKQAKTIVKSEMPTHWNIKLQITSQNRHQRILHVSKIPFVRKRLHNKQIHLCRIDPFITRPTWLLQTKNLVFDIWIIEPKALNWFNRIFIGFVITQIWDQVSPQFLQFIFFYL